MDTLERMDPPVTRPRKMRLEERQNQLGWQYPPTALLRGNEALTKTDVREGIQDEEAELVEAVERVRIHAKPIRKMLKCQEIPCQNGCPQSGDEGELGQ
jgi:hypothetical protein